MPLPIRTAAVLLAVAVAIASPAQIAAGETLRIKLPAGFHVGYKQSAQGIDMMELVTGGETVETWSQLVTVQIMHGRGNFTPEGFLNGLNERMQGACPAGTKGPPRLFDKNGYHQATASFRCPLNPQTGKPENVEFDAVQGVDSFYLVQYAFRRTPTPADRKAVADLFASVGACDSRKPEHPCTDLGAQGFRPAGRI